MVHCVLVTIGLHVWKSREIYMQSWAAEGASWLVSSLQQTDVKNGHFVRRIASELKHSKCGTV